MPAVAIPVTAARAGSRRPGRRRSPAVLAVLAVATAVTAACSSADTGTPELTWYINPDNGGQAELAQRCGRESGGRYTIATTLLPREASAQREQLVRRLAAGDESIDIMSLDPPFIPEFAEAGFLAEVPDDVAAATTQDVVASAVEGSTWRDQVVAVPFWANTQLLWYKRSVAEAAGLDMSQPVTWQQIIDAAAERRTEIAVQGIRAEALTVWVNALVESAGGQVLVNPEAPAEEVELGLTSPAGRQAAEVIDEIARRNLGGPALSTQNEDAGRALFESGAASFMVNWPFVYPAAVAAVEQNALRADVLADYGWTLYPRVTADRPSAPPYGGINLGVGAFSEDADLAWDAVQCIVQPENQAYYFISNGNPASNRSVYSDPAVLEAFPMAPEVQRSLEQAAPRPQTPYYNEVSQGLQNTWHPPRSVSPQTTPEASEELIRGVLRKERLL